MGIDTRGRFMKDEDELTELWQPPIRHNFFLKNGLTPASISLMFGLFQTNNTIFTTNKCKKCPSSLLCRDLNPQPLEQQPSPITTRQGLPFTAKLFNFDFLPIFHQLTWTKAYRSHLLRLPWGPYLRLPLFSQRTRVRIQSSVFLYSLLTEKKIKNLEKEVKKDPFKKVMIFLAFSRYLLTKVSTKEKKRPRMAVYIGD